MGGLISPFHKNKKMFLGFTPGDHKGDCLSGHKFPMRKIGER
jgi:hypothetical protein